MKRRSTFLWIVSATLVPTSIHSGNHDVAPPGIRATLPEIESDPCRDKFRTSPAWPETDPAGDLSPAVIGVLGDRQGIQKTMQFTARSGRIVLADEAAADADHKPRGAEAYSALTGKASPHFTAPLPPRNFQVGPDERTALFARSDFDRQGIQHQLQLLDVASGKSIRTSPSFRGELMHVDFSADGTSAVAALKGPPAELRVWNHHDPGARVIVIPTDPKRIPHDAKFSADGKKVAVCEVLPEPPITAVEITLYDSGTGEKIKSYPVPGGGPCTWDLAPHGDEIAVKIPGAIEIFALASGASQKIPDLDDETRALAFAPEGPFLLAGYGGQGAILYQTQTGTRLESMPLGTNLFFQLRFSPDGSRFLASAFNEVVVGNLNNLAGKPYRPDSAEVALAHLASPTIVSYQAYRWLACHREQLVGLLAKQAKGRPLPNGAREQIVGAVPHLNAAKFAEREEAEKTIAKELKPLSWGARWQALDAIRSAGAKVREKTFEHAELDSRLSRLARQPGMRVAELLKISEPFRRQIESILEKPLVGPRGSFEVFPY